MDNVTKKVVPLGEYVLFKQLKKDITPGGIILPETQKSEFFGFDVVAIGDEVKKIKLGDWIVFKNGDAIQVGNACVEEHLFLIKEKDVIGTIENLKGEDES